MGRPALDVEVRVLLAEVLVRGALAVQHGHDALAEGGHARPALEVAQVRLGAGDEHGMLALVQDLAHGAHLDGVAQGGAGAVRLVDVDLHGLELRLGEHRAQEALLGGAVGGRQAGTAAVGVRVAAREEGVGAGVAVQGVLALPDDHGRAALASPVAVSGAVEGEAAAQEGEHVSGAVPGPGAGREVQADARNDGPVERVGGEEEVDLGRVRRDEGRGAGGVHDEAWPLEVDRVGEAVGDEGLRNAVSGGHLAAVPPVRAADAHEDAEVRRVLVELLLVEAGVRHGEPAGLHEDPLLWVHAVGLRLREVEEAGVEDVDALDVALVPAVALARSNGPLLVVVVDVVVHVEAGAGDLQEAVAAPVPHRGPELLVHVSAARVAGRHAHHHDLLAGGRRRARGLPLRRLDEARCLLELELQRLREEEALEAEALPARLVAVVILVGEEHQQGVGLRGEGHLRALRGLRDKPELAAARAQEVEEGHALPAHHGQESVRLPGLRGGRRVPGLVPDVGEGEAQEEVGAAVHGEAEVLLRERRQELRKERVALVLRRQRGGEEIRGRLVLEGLQQRHLRPAALAQVAGLEARRQPREEVVLLETLDRVDDLRTLLGAQDDVHGGEPLLHQQL
mmetsp:Transcript_89371/g.278044  ORF Transcript_89371/g.278044 Transcript_89371/m.278044 type:complete len:624 (-) Transcript_89371:320-2191(-)